MQMNPLSFTKEQEAALKDILERAGAGPRTTPTINRISSRVQVLKQVGVRPSKSALSRLDLEFKLTRWARQIRETLEETGPFTTQKFGEAVGYRYQKPHLKAQRAHGEVALEEAYRANDFFADALLYACDWTVEGVWKGEKPLDRAIRRLARGVAADWKWATGKKLPKVRENEDDWAARTRFGPHPLWICA